MILYVPFSYPVRVAPGKGRRPVDALWRGETFVDLGVDEAPVAAVLLQAAGPAAEGRVLRRGPAGLSAPCGVERIGWHAPDVQPPRDWAGRVSAGEHAGWNPFRDLLDASATDEGVASRTGKAIGSGRDAAEALVREAAARITVAGGLPYAPVPEPYIVTGHAYETHLPGWARAMEWDPRSNPDPSRCFRLSDWAGVRERERACARRYGREPVLPERNPFADVLDASAFTLPFEDWAVARAAAGLMSALAARFSDAASEAGKALRGLPADGRWPAPDASHAPGRAESDALRDIAALAAAGFGPGTQDALAGVAAALAAALGPRDAGSAEPQSRRSLREALEPVTDALSRHRAWQREREGALAGARRGALSEAGDGRPVDDMEALGGLAP